MTFEDLGLSPEVLKAVTDAGYSQPTPIQQQAIPVVLMGRDVLGCAQTGTGKTAGFTLPMIDILAGGRAKARMPRSLILEPTRELAHQVGESFEKYGKFNKLNMALLIGGSSMGDQEAVLNRGVDVLIATPGRLLDLIERGKVLLADVKILVIDEADRMLDMGFIPDIEKIVGRLPVLRQTLFFSATMPPEIRRLADRFLSNPKAISVDPPSQPADTVTQALIRVSADPKAKRAVLRELLRVEEIQSALIFCNRKRDVATLQRSLERHGFDAKALHGDMSQPARTETLEFFKQGKIKLLVCSDVAARGLDIPAVSHVFNFDVPIHAEDYVHRIGRTGRAGRSGKAFTLASPIDGKFLAAINRMVGKEIPALQMEGIESVTADADAATTTEARPRRGERRSRKEFPPAAAPEAVTARVAKPRTPEPKTAEPKTAEPKAAEPKVATPKPAPVAAAAPAVAAPSAAVPGVAAAPRPARARQPERDRGRDRDRSRDDRGGRDRQPSNEPHLPTPTFGDHTPAFLLRPISALAG